jgi:hypothetical protein
MKIMNAFLALMKIEKVQIVNAKMDMKKKMKSAKK